KILRGLGIHAGGWARHLLLALRHTNFETGAIVWRSKRHSRLDGEHVPGKFLLRTREDQFLAVYLCPHRRRISVRFPPVSNRRPCVSAVYYRHRIDLSPPGTKSNLCAPTQHASIASLWVELCGRTVPCLSVRRNAAFRVSDAVCVGGSIGRACATFEEPA